jgi:nitroimidazol reductase NimA-like FMN-containing flavoprotein (pyridoxamine 5'-phosphate oxidase superfamily)
MELTTPAIDRPVAPRAYGYSTKKKGMLPWEEVRDALAAANIFWIGTTRPDGSSHIHPIWGGWVDETGYFEGGDTTRWGRNLAADQRISFGVESNGMHVSGRGTVTRGAAGASFAALTSNYQSKYAYQPEADGHFWRISPTVIIALKVGSMDEFMNTPTRFKFA